VGAAARRRAAARRARRPRGRCDAEVDDSVIALASAMPPQAMTILDPTAEVAPVQRELAPRGRGIDGATIALVDIRKARGDVFLDRLEEMVASRYPSATVLRMSKPTFTKPAPAAFLDKVLVAGADFVVEGLAD
jgi:hypothetical protein